MNRIRFLVVLVVVFLARNGVAQDKKPADTPSAFLQIHETPAGQAEALAKLLAEVFRDAKVRIVGLNAHQIAVWGNPADQAEIARHLRRPPAQVELISLTMLDAPRTADTLRAMFGEPKTGGPFLEATATQNAIVVRGTADQIMEIKSALIVMGEGGGRPTGNVRTIVLDKGSGASLAEALSELMGKMRSNPVKVIVPGKLDARDDKPEDKPEPPKKSDDKNGALPGKVAAPVTITGFGNRVIVVSEDPAALALVVELSRLLQAPAGDCDYQTLRLKHGKAENIARIVDEAFNGKSSARVERIRVIADADTNSILFRASPLDAITIRNLVARSLDLR